MYKTICNWVGKVIHWELGKKFKFHHINKGYTHNSESIQENKMHKILWDFEIQTDHLILARRPDLVIVNKKKRKKRTCWIVNFAIPSDERVKLKESKKRDKYLDLARELKKKLWNMKVIVIPIVIGVYGTVTKQLVPGLEDLDIRRVEINQTTALLRSARILGRVLETCCLSSSYEKPSANTGVKNPQKRNK